MRLKSVRETNSELIVNLRKQKWINSEFAKWKGEFKKNSRKRERESEIPSVNWKLVREKDSESINSGAH